MDQSHPMIKPTKKRPTYSNEFKKQIVKMYNDNFSVDEISATYGVSNTAIYSWIKQYSNNIVAQVSDKVLQMNDYKELKEENIMLKKVISMLIKQDVS